ncbi:hypothetical protein [Longimicrobium sp.]|jgi:hypothetical protein|uniref:hypothetical protein n=1 Tax=Longimicrobium sp. TaxID=2029185 RepID=UPI002F94C845
MDQDRNDGGFGSGTSGSSGDLSASTGGSAGGGLGGSTGSGLGGSTGAGSAGGLGGSTGSGLGGSTGAGSTGGLGGSTGGLGGSTGAGSTGGGLGGTTGSLGSSGGDLGGASGTVSFGGSEDDFGTAETTYQRHYATVPATPATGPSTYDEARTGYELGHRAAANPTYSGRDFNEVEVDIRRDYGEDKEGRFERIRGFAAHAYDWKMIVGGIALAAGGWWAGRKLYESLRDISEEEEQECRTYYESHPVRTTGVPYDRARTVYVVGYAAARNPEYAGRSFDDVEPHLRSGFSGSRAASYDSLRDFARRGYERGTSRSGGGTTSTGTTGTGGYGSTGTGTGGGTAGGVGGATGGSGTGGFGTGGTTL